MSDQEQDPLVDAVAGRLTAVADDPAFRAHLVSRLPPRVEVPRWRGWLVPAAVTMFALTGIGGVVQLMRESRVVPAAPQVVTAPAIANPVQAPAAPVGDATSAGPAVAPRVAALSPLAPSSVPALPLLETEPLLPMTNIQPAAMTTPLLDVTPIATAPLVLAPLDGGKD